MISFSDWIRFHAAMRPAGLAIATPRGRLTYSRLFQVSHSIAMRLHRHGVKPGDKAGIFIVNLALQTAVLVALNRLGAAVCILPQWESRRGAAMKAVPFDWVVTDVQETVEPGVSQIGVDGTWLTETAGAADLPRFRDFEPDAPCLLAISSGTVSKSKPIAFTAAQIERRIAWRCFEEQETFPGERTFVHLSSASMLSFLTVFGTLYAGGAVYSGWHGEQAAAVIAQENIARLVSTPPLLLRLMPALENQSAQYPHLRLIYSGGDMLSEPLSRRITARLCRNLVTAFGTNETGQIAVGRVESMGFHPQMVGIVLPWAEVEVVDDDDVPLPANTEGRFRFRTPGTASGYLDNPEATAQHFKDSWFYPGDIGALTQDRVLIMGGRLADLIKTPGGHISPRPVDLAAAEYDGVSEAAAFGVRRPGAKDEIWLAVTGSDDLNMNGLRQFCIAKLGDSAPQHFMKLDELPRNESGKVLRWALADMAIAKDKQG